MRHALVTGGAGFIGSHLVEGLLEDGLEVISIDDYSGGKRDNVARFLSNPGFSEVACDVTDAPALAPHFEGVDIVFHQAASKMSSRDRVRRRDESGPIPGSFASAASILPGSNNGRTPASCT